MSISLLTAARPFAPERMNSFLSSILKSTTDITQVEVLVKIDHDCSQTLEIVNNYKNDLNIKPIIMNGNWRRTGLMRYWNELGSHATKDIMWFLNDRVILETEGWDKLLEKHSKDPLISYPAPWKQDSINLLGMMPVISRKWFDTLGYVTKHNAADVFMNMVASELGPKSYIPGLHASYAHSWTTYPEPKEIADSLRCIVDDPIFKQDVEDTVKLLQAVI